MSTKCKQKVYFSQVDLAKKIVQLLDKECVIKTIWIRTDYNVDRDLVRLDATVFYKKSVEVPETNTTISFEVDKSEMLRLDEFEQTVLQHFSEILGKQLNSGRYVKL